MALVTVDWLSDFCSSLAPRLKTRSQDLPESKAKWAITLRCDTSEASRGKGHKKKKTGPWFVQQRGSARSTFIRR